MVRPERLTWTSAKDPDIILRVLTRYHRTPARRVPGAFDGCTTHRRCWFAHTFGGTMRRYCSAPTRHECAHRRCDAWPGPPVTLSGEKGDPPLSTDARTREVHRAILHHSLDIALTGSGIAAKAGQVLWKGDEWGVLTNEHRTAAQVALAVEIASRITHERRIQAEARKRAKMLGRKKP